MIPLKDQELKIENGVILERPKCPTCPKGAEAEAFVYNEVRQQFQCGRCFSKDCKALEELQRRQALAVLTANDNPI